MRNFRSKKQAGLSIAEMLIYCVITVILGMVVFSVLRTGSALSAKSVSINRSHDALRTALDRLANNLRMARNVPILLDANAATVTTGNAAGVRYDRIVGEPYVLDPVATSGSVSAAATSMTIYRSVSGVSAPPIPVVNDILIVDTPDGSIRARITAVTATPATANTQKIILNFSAAVGKSLSWGVNQPQWARLVRQEAFLVKPDGAGKNELRFYPSFEPMPTLTDKTKYVVITNQIGTNTGEATPFSIVDTHGDKIVQANIRVQSTDHNRWLANKQANEFNTYFRMNLLMTSRLRPKNSN